MKLITVLLAAWFMLATTTAAHADPVSLITGLIGAISSIGAVGQLLIGVGLKVGMSLLERARAKKNQPQQAGVQGSLRTGGDNPLSFIVGTYATAGSLEYVGTWGKANKTPNAYLTQVISLSDLPITAMSNKVWISGKECTIDWSAEPVAQGYPVLEYRVEGKDFLWVLFFDGTQTAPSQFLLDCFPGGDRPWKSDMIGRGIAYAAVTARMNREILTSGPSCTFVLQGIKVYDLRKDSTAGGIGAQRWGVQSTYQFSDNPKVIDYNIKRGIYYDGQWVYGGQGMRAFQLPASNWMAAMNECDRQVALAGGGTEKQFRCGGEITVDYQPIEACKELDKSCNGRTAELGGIYKTICGAPGPSVYAFTDDDMVITEPQTLDPFPGLEDTVNGVNATYPEPSEAWTIKDAPPRYNATYEAADAGHRLLLDIAYPLVPYGKQVQRLTRTLLREGRNFRKQTGVLPPEAWLIEPLDAVTLTSVRNGYATKRFLMGEMDDLDNVNQGVAFTELDPSDYDWSPSFELPTSVGPLGPIEPPPTVMDGWGAVPWHIDDADGRARRPAVKVRAAADLDDVRAVRVMARIKATGVVVFDSAAYAYAAPFEWVIGGSWCLPGALVQVRGLEVPYSGRKVDWSAWIDVLIDDIRISPDDLHLDLITKEIHSQLSELQDWVWRDTNIRELIEDRKSLALGAALQDLANFADKQELRVELVAATQELTASFTDKITVATSATVALAQRVSTVEVKFDGYPAASVINTSIAKVTTLEGSYASLAADLTTVQAALSDKIGSTVFNSLASTVTQQGNTLTLQGDIINQIDLELDGKASLAAQNVLAGTVNTQGGLINSHGTLLNSLSAQVGEVSADARLRFEVVNNSGGTGYSTIGLQARFGTADSFRSAGVFIKTPSDPAQMAEFIVNAQRFAVAAGNDENGVKIFAVDGSGVYMDSAYIRNLNVLKLVAGASSVFKVDGSGVYMDTAFIRSISTNKITFEDGSVQTSAIADGAVGKFAYVASLPEVESAADLPLDLVVNHGTGSPRVLLFANGSYRKKFTDDVGAGIDISPGRGGAFVSLPGATMLGINCPYTCAGTHLPGSSTATTTYTMTVSGRGYSRNREFYALVMRRPVTG